MTIKSSGSLSMTEINAEFNLGRNLGAYRGITHGSPVNYQYDEGATATSANWDNGQLFYMDDISGLGAVTMHGYTPWTQYNLTLNSLPEHSQFRYQLYWHCVDSLDGRDDGYWSTLTVDDYTYLEFARLTYEGNSLVLHTNNCDVAVFTSATYSYSPFATAHPGLSVNSGYVMIDTGWKTHTASSMTIGHFLGADQAQDDEAMYLSHVKLQLRVTPPFPNGPISFSNFYSASKLS